MAISFHLSTLLYRLLFEPNCDIYTQSRITTANETKLRRFGDEFFLMKLGFPDRFSMFEEPSLRDPLENWSAGRSRAHGADDRLGRTCPLVDPDAWPAVCEAGQVRTVARAVASTIFDKRVNRVWNHIDEIHYQEYSGATNGLFIMFNSTLAGLGFCCTLNDWDPMDPVL